jgi:phosphatidylserine/phosphatidylglycerophosphate/cardiolipin synthase-like enzyme
VGGRQARVVDVRVVAPGDKHDMPFVRAAQRSTYEALVRGGVGVWEFSPTMMHSKSLVVDDRYAMVSSINLDPMSMRQARECGLEFWAVIRMQERGDVYAYKLFGLVAQYGGDCRI